MRTLLINYATPDFRVSQKLNSRTGLEVGGLDAVRNFGPRSLSWSFRRKHAKLLSCPRGAGYWIWKPYIILKALMSLREGDILFYCDSGAYFVSSAAPLIEIARTRQEVVCFSVGLPEWHWTKRDAFILMDCDRPEFVRSSQRLSGFILARRCDSAIVFFRQWLSYGADGRIVSDAENTLGFPNYDGFRENRHDQTVFSLLTKKWGFACYRDPSRGPEIYYSGIEPSCYPMILESTRQRNPVSPAWLPELARRVRRRIRRVLSRGNRAVR